MSLRNKSRVTSVRHKQKYISGRVIFYPLIILTFLLWVLYRQLFVFPVWFDEVLGKAVFFGLPVWLYINVTNNRIILNSFARNKLKSGLLLGVAVGGIYGFVSSIMSLLTRGGQVQSALLFSSNLFWWEFFLAMMTAFWETLFFYSFVMIALKQKYPHWSLLKQILTTAIIFLLFHLPNAFLRFDGAMIVFQVGLLFAFAVGQAFLFARRENFYALVLSHAIWGMVLLVHF